MSIAERVRTDLATAMKAGDRGRIGALRFVLSELQKAEKDGGADETAVLVRERKRRLEAAGQFREAGRGDLAEAEEAEASLISAYLPDEMGADELVALVEQKVAEAGAESPRDMGRVMGLVMPAVGARADGRRVSAVVREVLGA